MSLNIFAIEDDRDALANLRDILGLDGHRVTGAGTIQLDPFGRQQRCDVTAIGDGDLLGEGDRQPKGADRPGDRK